MPIISALEKLSQQDHEFKARVGYIARTISKKQNKTKVVCAYLNHSRTKRTKKLPNPTSVTTMSLGSSVED
jgi:hypothetical protein